jgi:hypothetical protein
MRPKAAFCARSRRERLGHGKKQARCAGRGKAPEESCSVSDGVRMHAHARGQPGPRRAVPADDQATTAVLFLTAGEADQGLHCQLIEGAPAGTYALKLQPKLEERTTTGFSSWLTGRRSRSASDGRRQADKGHDRRSRSRISENVGLPIRRFSSHPARCRCHSGWPT